VVTEDVISVSLGVPCDSSLSLLDDLALLSLLFLGFLYVIAWESLVVVGYKQSTINSAFHGTEDSVTSSGSDETNIQVCLEWSLVQLL